jgi:hypothetical protein
LKYTEDLFRKHLNIKTIYNYKKFENIYKRYLSSRIFTQLANPAIMDIKSFKFSGYFVQARDGDAATSKAVGTFVAPGVNVHNITYFNIIITHAD